MACSEDRSLQQYVKKRWERVGDAPWPGKIQRIYLPAADSISIRRPRDILTCWLPTIMLFTDPIYALTPSVHELSTINFEDQWVPERHYLGTKMVPWDCLSQNKGNHRPSSEHDLSRRFSEVAFLVWGIPSPRLNIAIPTLAGRSNCPAVLPSLLY